MNQLFTNTISWNTFMLIILVLALIYLLLYGLSELTKRNFFSQHFPLKFKSLFRQIFIVYELLAIVILISAFVSINPLLHSLIVLFIGLGSIPYFKSYIRGRWIHFDNSIIQGVELKTGNLTGVVSKMERLKIHLQTNEGLHHLSYSSLLEKGYTLVSGDEIGGFYHLKLIPKDSIKTIRNHRLHLLDLLATAPYVDWHHRPELFQDDNDNTSNAIDARVLIKEESHLHELIALIREWGYQCAIQA